MTQVIDIFYAIDFDRCLSDTPKLDEVFYQLAREYSKLDVEELIKARRAIEDQGESFDQVGALSERLTASEMSDFFGEFIKRASNQEVLSAGARQLMEALKRNNKPFSIVSYGDMRWQSIKIEASGLWSVPTLITDHKRKAEVVASWQQADKSFLIPKDLNPDKMSAKQIVLLDDKAIAFSGLPAEARGYWVQPSIGELLPAQKGEVPDNVRTVRGLLEVVTLENLS
jgi:hypothetical protein